MAKNILIVDDNPQVLKLLHIFLTKAGYHPIEAENGEIGLQMANEHKPDLIISDVMMPGMDGIEFCWMIRENSEVPNIPFIFLTSFNDPETRIKGFRTGADKYLIKPIDRVKLISTVEELLSRFDRVKKLEEMDKIGEASSIKGDLKELSIVEIVQMFNLSKKTGILHIAGKSTGEIFLLSGQIQAAFCGDVTGEKAILKLVEMGEGTFVFETKETLDQEKNIEGSTMNIIMEACQIMDEKRLKESGGEE